GACLRCGDRSGLPGARRRVPRRAAAARADRSGRRILDRTGERRRSGRARCRAGSEGGRAGMKVIVTRPRQQAGPLVERLEALGLEVVECPLIEVVRTSDDLVDCAGYEW